MDYQLLSSYPFDGYYGYSGEASGSAECSGAVTAYFYWIAYDGEPAPLSVVVTIESQAYWSVDGNFDGAVGQADDGQDDPEGIYVNPGGEWGFGNSQGTHYKIKGGSSFSVTINPNAHVSGGDNNIAGVFLKVSATPVRIGLSGTTDDGNTCKVLTGQQLTASLDPMFPGTTPTWSITEGADECFGDFVVSSDKSTGTVLPIDFGNDRLKFYTKKAGAVKAHATATILLPDGTTPSVSADSREVMSVRPIVSGAFVTSGHVVFDTNIPSGYGLVGGQVWFAHVTIDPPFASSGQAAYCQIITPSRSLTPVAPALPFKNVNYGLPGLDTYFPLPGSGSPTTPCDVQDGDSPSMIAPYTYNGEAIVVSSAQDSFTTYLIFRPFAAVTDQNTTWVPLQKHDWNWAGMMSRPDANSYYSPTSHTDPNSMITPDNTFDHPTWQRLHVAGGFFR